jgi:Na+/H+ antiporter NhaD/arsenite permease-like protein
MTSMPLPQILGVPLDFLLFAATLVGIALFHRHTLFIALAGLLSITIYKVLITGFREGHGASGLIAHIGQEWVMLANLFGLLTGFAILARHFEQSRLPDLMPDYLPDDWTGGLVLLGMVFILSSFLDNIAAALIGGTTARHVFRSKVHIGYLAAIVAAANACGSWSVIGDTTTTMMWIDGISPLTVFEAIIAAVVSFAIFATIAARRQHQYSPIVKDAPRSLHLYSSRLFTVGFILLIAVAVNVVSNLYFPEIPDRVPILGLAVWASILVTAGLCRPDWRVIPPAVKGSIFLLSLVLCASMMPVESLPAPSWQTAFGAGVLSAVFDNIPLTALALKQGGYDWGYLAFAVGFGGTIIWFGSSAGVAVSNLFPEAKSTVEWVRRSWYVPLSYVVAFGIMLLVLGWHPDAPHD